jgi:heptosyltransferase-2
MADPITARRVLIRVPNWVGDVVHSLPALSAIRTHFVEAELTAIARGEAGTLLHGCPFVDKIESYGAGRSLLGIGQTAAGLRKGDFDLGIVLTNSFEGAFLFFLAGIRHRVGYATDGRRWLLSDPIDCPLSTKRLHQAEYYLAMLSKIGIRTRGPTAKLRLEQSERQKVRERLVKAGWFPRRRLFALCPGAGSGSAKRWPMARFVSLAERLAANLGGQVIFLGGPTERELGRFVDERGSERLVNFIGKTTLREAMALIDACELVVSNDSGLLHIAGALGVPVVALFGPTDPERTGPRSSPSVVLRRGVECSPCELHECPIDHRCMDQLAVDEVYAAVVTFIKKQTAGARDLH